MATIKFGEFKPRSSMNSKKLTLEKGETARVVYLETEPTVVFIHSFEKVKTGPNGKVIIKQDKWPDGSPRESYETEYAGKMKCLGDVSVLMGTGADPENCPACKAAVENPKAVRRAQARFLGHVFKYNTKNGTTTPSKPFSGVVEVWDLTERRFESVNAIYLEHGPLPAKDLLLGPCENKQMQKYDIAVGSDAKWMETEDTQKYVKEALEDGRVEDLSATAAPVKSSAEMQAKVSEIVRAFNHATGAGGSSYESLFDSDNSTSEPEEEELQNVSEDTIDEEAGEVLESADSEDEAEAEAQDKTPDLNDLLASIGIGK